MAAARARGVDELTVWLAGVTGAERPVVHVRTIGAEAAVAGGDGAMPLGAGVRAEDDPGPH
jgi:hypothetical protein